MSTKKLLVRICKKCGTVYSTAKERCEDCRERLSEPMSQKLASLESEVIITERYIAGRSASKNYCTEEDSKQLFVSTAIYRKLVPTLPSERKRQDQRRLKRLHRRLERLRKKENCQVSED